MCWLGSTGCKKTDDFRGANAQKFWASANRDEQEGEAHCK